MEIEGKSVASESTSSSGSVADPRRRALLGGATTGSLAVAASAGVLALWRPGRAEAASTFSAWYDAKVDFHAAGNGSSDDTSKLQSAINAAVADHLPLYIPPGTYKITTALTIPSYLKLFGAGRNFSTVIQPNNCGLFIIDGSLYTSGWVQGIFISDLAADLTGASATNAIYINHAYNIGIRDCFFNNSGSAVGCNTLIQNCNDVVLDNTSICGNSNTISSNPLGLHIVGGTVKLIASDCEYFIVAMKVSGTAVVDMISPTSKAV